MQLVKIFENLDRSKSTIKNIWIFLWFIVYKWSKHMYKNPQKVDIDQHNFQISTGLENSDNYDIDYLHLISCEMKPTES